jgi:hypothetical protein
MHIKLLEAPYPRKSWCLELRVATCYTEDRRVLRKYLKYNCIPAQIWRSVDLL